MITLESRGTNINENSSEFIKSVHFHLSSIASHFLFFCYLIAGVDAGYGPDSRFAISFGTGRQPFRLGHLVDGR